MAIVNLTPHPVRLISGTGELIAEYPATGLVARIQVEDLGAENTLVKKVGYLGVTGLPPSSPGVLFVVSLLVALAVSDRDDVVAPYDEVRDSQGRVIGCRALQKASR